MQVLLNIILPLLIPIVIFVAWFIVLKRSFASKHNFWKSNNPRTDWQVGLCVSVVFMILTVTTWAQATTSSAVPFFSDNRWMNVMILAFVFAWGWFYTVRIQHQKISKAFLNFGYVPSDERETLLLLKASHAAYVTVMGLLVLVYIISLFFSLPSQTSFIYLIISIAMLSRAAFTFSLDRLGFPAR